MERLNRIRASASISKNKERGVEKDGLSDSDRLNKFKDAGIPDKYLTWALRSYFEDGITSLTDLPVVFEYLNIFDNLLTYKRLDDKKNVGNFIFNERDINNYCGLIGCKIKYQRPGLKNWIDEYHMKDIEEINEIINRKNRESEEAEYVFETPNVLIIHPKTQEASCQYGAGTKWCTAATKNNMFNTYNQQGLLYIIIDKKTNKKYQIHFETNQYVKSNDTPISPSRLIREIPDLLEWFKLQPRKIAIKIAGVVNLDYVKWFDDKYGLSINEIESIILTPDKLNKKIVTYLLSKYQLSVLDLSRKKLLVSDAIFISSILKEKGNVIKELFLDRTEIGYEEIKEIAEALKINTTLTTLSLRENNIGSRESIKELTEALKINEALNDLDLGGNYINTESINELAEALKYNITLNNLDLSQNNIGTGGSEGIKGLTDALQYNTTLTALNLEENNIGIEDATELAEALKYNIALATLNLEGNEIGAMGAKELAKSLKYNTTLTTLNLGGNKIGATGAKELAEALNINKTLTTLILDVNNIRSLGAKELAATLNINKTLINLSLRSNKIGDDSPDGIRELASALKVNTTLTTLDLDRNNIGAFGSENVTNLASALKVNTTLNTLRLGGNKIKSSSAKKLAEEIKKGRVVGLNLK